LYDATGKRLPYHVRRPDAYKSFVTHNVTMSKEKGCEGLMDISLIKLCPEVYFQDFIDCLKSWLKNTLGESGPYHLHKVDISYNNLSNASLKNMMKEFKALELRIDLLNLSGNYYSDLHPLIDYIWEGEQPIKALGLRNNRLQIDDINGLIRCIYNHENYPEKSKNNKSYVPLRIELEGNPCCEGTKLSDLLNEIVHKCGHEKMYISVDDRISD